MASAYKTVHKSAILIISDVLSIGLQVNEAKNVNGKTVNVDNARKRTIQHWQEEWKTKMSGRWTAKLLPYITRWMDRKFGKVNYYLTQLLPTHGYFYRYLFKMRKMIRPNCIYDDVSIDGAKHTFFHCERWRLERKALEGCTVEGNLNSLASYTEALLKTEKFDLDKRSGMDV